MARDGCILVIGNGCPDFQRPLGHVLADTLLGRENEETSLLARRGIWLPPEPLRWLLARGILGALELADALTDRAIRRL